MLGLGREQLFDALLALRRDLDAARDDAAGDPFEFEEPVSDRGAERAGEVVGLFCPVDAVAQGCGGGEQWLLHAQLGEAVGPVGGEPVAGALAGRGEPVDCVTGVIAAVAARDPSRVDHVPEQLHAELARQVPVAGSRGAQGVGAGVLAQRCDRGAGGEAGERLEDAFDVGAGQPVVPVAALLRSGDQAVGEQDRQVIADGGGGDSGFFGQPPGRQRPAIGQCYQDPDPPGVGEGHGDVRQVGLSCCGCGHVSDARRETLRPALKCPAMRIEPWNENGLTWL